MSLKGFRVWGLGLAGLPPNALVHDSREFSICVGTRIPYLTELCKDAGRTLLPVLPELYSFFLPTSSRLVLGLMGHLGAGVSQLE